jgi:two-component sensor histidine kinase
VNELVSNSIKYAFPGEMAGKIVVSCQKTYEDHYLLTVEDDGLGMPAEFDLAKSSSLGLKLVTSLARQIDGNVGISSSKGTQFVINFVYSENGS